MVMIVVLTCALTLIWWVWWQNVDAHGGHYAVLTWTEDNQGLVSVAALAFALLWALWENHRANTEGQRQATAFNDAISDLIDRSVRALTDLENAQNDHPGNPDYYWKWDHSRALTRKALDYLRQAGPPDASLTIALTELDELFENRLGQGNRLPDGRTPFLRNIDPSEFKDLRDKLKDSQTKIRGANP
ncbi:hypothetical protein [Caulobacter sp.]|uniref:hypothetical protein n=1 Tax=Caulobacter sp. TaxID=78 RepID=UPI001B00D2D7|nr:hypothetical protein [Caulobacter sp.]MBO9543838.1 hypothetical protein [Caulobacter sp.]